MADTDPSDFFDRSEKANDFFRAMSDHIKRASSEFDSLNSGVESFSKAIHRAAKNFAEIPNTYKSIVDLGERTNAQLRQSESLRATINDGRQKELDLTKEIAERSKAIHAVGIKGSDENIKYTRLLNEQLELEKTISRVKQQQIYLSGRLARGAIDINKYQEEQLANNKILDEANHNKEIAQKNLSFYDKKALENSIQQLRYLGDSLIESKNLYGVERARADKLMVINSLYERTLGISAEFKNMVGLGNSLLRGGAEAYVAILKISLDRWIQLDKAAGEFRKTTGLLATQMVQVRKAIEEANVSLSYAGVTLEKANESAAQLVGVFGTIALVSRDLVVNSAQLAANLGLSVTDIGEFNSKFMSAAKMSGTTTENIIHSAAKLSEMAGVAPKQVMEDMANASENTLMFLAKNPMQLMRATVEARRLGTTVNALAKASREMLDYQSSMTSELEASALLNQNISFQLSRQLAWEGKIVESREEALDQIKAAGDFTRMSVYQQEALAKAAGMTVEEVSKQLNQREMLAALQNSSNAEDRAQYNAYVKMNAKLKADDADAKKDLLGRGREMAKQMLMQAEMDKLANSLKAAWISIQDALLPIANAIMPPLLFGLRLAGQLIRFISTGIKMLFAPFQSFLSAIGIGNGRLGTMENWAEKIEGWLAIWVSWGKNFSDWLDTASGWFHDIVRGAGAALGIFATWKLLSASIGGIWGAGGKIISGISAFGRKIFDVTKGLLGMSSATKTAASSAGNLATPKAVPKGPNAVSQFLTGVKWGDVGKMAALMVILAGGIWALGKALKTFNEVNWDSLAKAAVALGGLWILKPIMNMFSIFQWNTIAKAAAVMVVLAGGIWTLGKALKTFNEVNWDSLAKGGLALVGLIGAIKLISMVPIDTKGLLSAAAAMVVVGGALWVLGEALNKFNTVDWSSIGKASVALGGLMILGAIAGYFSPVALGMLAVGAAAAMLGAGLLGAGAGFALFGKGVEYVGSGISKVVESISTGIAKVIGSISTGVTAAANALVTIVQPIQDLSDIGLSDLLQVSIGIKAISSSLKELSNSFSGTQVFKNLIALTNLSTRLDVIANALAIIKQNSSIDLKITGIKDFQELTKNPIDITSKIETQVKVAVEAVTVKIENLDELPAVIDKLANAISKLGGTSIVPAEPVAVPANDNNAVVAKIDELISLMRSGVKVDTDVMSFSRAAAAGGR